MRIALSNAARAVLLQIVAIAYVVFVGLDAGAALAAGVTAVFGFGAAVWRWVGARTLLAKPRFDENDLRSGTRMLEANAALAGLAWVVSTVGFYPLLHGTVATTYVGIICGSIGVAAFFMSLVGRAFLILAALQLGALTVVSLLSNATGSVPMAVLATVFGLTSHRAAMAFRRTTEHSIQHSLDADRANLQLKVALEGAEAANIAKGQFLATMSHEIRTPMNGVLGALDLLRRTRLDTQQRRLVRTAASSGETLMAILNDVLDHSKIEAGKLTLQPSPTSLHSLASSVAALFRSNAEAKGLLLSLDIEPETIDWVLADGQRLKQVLLNLVGNAVKFTERGGITLSLRPVAAAVGRSGVAFEVRDTGIGMPAEELAAVFEPFHQVQGATMQRRGGTGLGLAISQRIVAAMGGVIEVQSTPGEGSRFRFVVEFEPDPSPQPAQVEDSAHARLDDQPTLAGNVLVVEDNDVNRMIACEMLRAMGVQPLEAADGAEAIEQLEREPVDLVLMDVQMPVMDGYTATQKIREREARLGLAHLPIVALTANAYDEDAAYALAIGMDAHLAKPYTHAQLRGLLVTGL
jgi:signal transduction histidine kinase/CheY-like chemotaxis protein